MKVAMLAMQPRRIRKRKKPLDNMEGLIKTLDYYSDKKRFPMSGGSTKSPGEVTSYLINIVRQNLLDVTKEELDELKVVFREILKENPYLLTWKGYHLLGRAVREEILKLPRLEDGDDQNNAPTTKSKKLAKQEQHVTKRELPWSFKTTAASLPRASFIVKDLSQSMWDKITNVSSKEAFDQLRNWSYKDLKDKVKLKIGTGQLNQRVEFNTAYKANKTMTMEIHPRKGYKLITFEFD